MSGAGSRARDSLESPGTLPRRFKVLMRAPGRAAKPGARFQFPPCRGFEARQLAAGLGAKVALSQSRGDFLGRRACGPAEGLRVPAGTYGKPCLKLRTSAIINALFFVRNALLNSTVLQDCDSFKGLIYAVASPVTRVGGALFLSWVPRIVGVAGGDRLRSAETLLWARCLAGE